MEMKIHILPETNVAPKRKFIYHPLIFRGEQLVSGRVTKPNHYKQTDYSICKVDCVVSKVSLAHLKERDR